MIARNQRRQLRKVDLLARAGVEQSAGRRRGIASLLRPAGLHGHPLLVSNRLNAGNQGLFTSPCFFA